jgi:hypothetical protein
VNHSGLYTGLLVCNLGKADIRSHHDNSRKVAGVTSATTQIPRQAGWTYAALFLALLLMVEAPQADIAEMMVARRAASTWPDMVALVRKVVNYSLSTSRAPFPLVQEALCCCVHLRPLILVACQSLVPLHLAVDAEPLVALAIAAADSLPVQLELAFRNDDGAAARACRLWMRLHKSLNERRVLECGRTVHKECICV